MARYHADIVSIRIGPSPRVYLPLLAGLILVPALLLAGWLSLQSAQSTRAEIETNARHQTYELLTAIDHEISAIKGTLIALATSQHLQSDDFGTFYIQAQKVASSLDLQVVLFDLRNRSQIINTAFPWGTTLEGGVTLTDQMLAELSGTTTPVISNLVYGPKIKRHVVSVAVNIAASDGKEYVLAIAVSADKICMLVEHALRNQEFIATIGDRNLAVVARSARHADFVGRKLNPEAVELVSGREGVASGRNLDGVPTTFFFSRSQLTGWLVVVGVPDSLLEAPTNTAIKNLVISGGTMLLVAFAAAYAGGGYLARSAGALGIDREPTRREFQMLFDAVPNGVLVFDSENKIALANSRIERKFGYTRDELNGKTFDFLITELVSSDELGSDKKFVLNSLNIGVETVGRRKDGSAFPIEVSTSPISLSSGVVTIATVIDISVRKKAEEQLSAFQRERDVFRRQIMQAQEDERLRLAHELHDQTGQLLTAVILEAKQIEATVSEEARLRLRWLSSRMEEMGQSLHRIALELRPTSIDDLGLHAALANYLAEWSGRYSIEADFQCGFERLDALQQDVRTTTYRVIQEAMNNVAKHAIDARSVSVIIECLSFVLHVTVEDDGQGFNVTEMGAGNSSQRRRGLGLMGMRERVSLIGGNFEIESSIGVGTTVFVRIPLDQTGAPS